MFHIHLWLWLAFVLGTSAQYPQSNWPYSGPTDSAKRWYDEAKFGLFIHWAPVSQWGDELSWPLYCPSFPCSVQGFNNTVVNVTNVEQLANHRKAYYNLANTFNPKKFDPDLMAMIAKKTGFKYVVFTTEHCDGFCNYNTSYSAYNSLNTPFGKDIFAMVAKSFRAQGIRVGAYLCPSLWNNPNYWQPDPLTALGPGCSPNFNPQSNILMWEKFISHLHGQAKELAEQYKPDLFWFDCINYPPALDLRLEEFAPIARAINPDVMITNRDGGLLQDFVTTNDKDEQSVSSILGVYQMNAGTKFEVPSVMATNGQWGYDPYAVYKTPRLIIGNLIMIVAKGGNYLVNLGPSPDGVWDPSAVEVFDQIANWMAINGEAIFATQPVWPYEYQTLTSIYPDWEGPPPFYTTMKGDTMYVLMPTADDILPETVIFPWIRPALFQGLANVTNVELLGLGADVQWEVGRGGLMVNLPFKRDNALGPLQYAFVWKVSLAKAG